MKHLKFTHLVIFTSLALTGCATSEIEKKLEHNFVYQCSLQLFDKLEKKVTGADAEKICTAAHNEELEKEGRKTNAVIKEVVPSATPAAADPVVTSTPASSAKALPAETDEVKPEPTPKK